jgi:hypothetical protein
MRHNHTGALLLIAALIFSLSGSLCASGKSKSYEKVKDPKCGFPGSEACVEFEKEGSRCLVYPHAIVWTREPVSGSTASFQAEPRDPSATSNKELLALCKAGAKIPSASHDGDFVGLSRHYAAGDVSEGAGRHVLSVIDVETGKEIFSSNYAPSEGAGFEPNNVFSFWERDRTPPYDGCPGEYSADSRVFHQIKADLPTGHTTQLPDLKCSTGE